jgi:hypothetical protein
MILAPKLPSNLPKSHFMSILFLNTQPEPQTSQNPAQNPPTNQQLNLNSLQPSISIHSPTYSHAI